MKIGKKIFVSLCIIVCMLTVIPSNFIKVEASKSKVSALVGTMTGDEIEDSYSTELIDTINSLLGFVQLAAGIISVVVICFTCFNYITASTPDMKEEVKKKMLPLIIGMVLVFGASSIARFILGAVETPTNPAA